MTEHKPTISALYRHGWHAFPKSAQLPLLQLAGLWMRDAGFYPGAQVRVDVVGDGRLVVTRVEEGEEEREMQPVVWVPADQIGRIDEVSASRLAGAACV